MTEGLKWGDKPYHSLDYELKQRFGEKVYKIPLDGGFTCPNRDGTLDTRGCIFCSGSGSGDFAMPRSQSITTQINQGMHLLNSKKNAGKKFIAYFQSFTGTYAPVSVLDRLYNEAVSHPDVIMLSIATRPDCLSPDILRLLEKYRRHIPVTIEFGLQTIHPQTVKYIRRGYETAVYDTAVELCKSIGIEVVTHVIAGLPHETADDFLCTVSHAACAGTDGIKLQLLHVLKGTDLAHDYLAHRFSALCLEQYLSLITEAICILPRHVVIHRLTGDAPGSLLIAPEWSRNKRMVLNRLHRKMKEEHIWQSKKEGDLYVCQQ